MQQRDAEHDQDRQGQDLVRHGDAEEGHDRGPEDVQDRDQHTDALIREPGEPARGENPALPKAEAALARQEGLEMLEHDLHPARSPAMALLLVVTEGVRQQAMAVAAVGVMLQPALLEDRQAKIGIFADRILGPATSALHRGAADQAHRAMGDDGILLVAEHHADIEEAGIFRIHRLMQR
jgi:hypothetical protein